jgi:membrane fusion protein, multidrug efflux system
MKQLMMMSMLVILAACGGGKKDANATLTDKKLELDKLRKEKETVAAQITKLEEEINKLDPAAAAESSKKLVAVTVIQPEDFAHYIDLQGRISTENVYIVTPRGMGGQVKSVHVKLGDRVRQGQLLLKLDDAVVRQQMAQLKTQLDYARDLYNRQQAVWKEGIGTEVQVLNAKNAVENLEKQMSLLNEQMAMTNVYAPASGVAETVNIRVGELFNGNPAAGITIINPSSLKAVVDVPENYSSKVKKGMDVIIDVPDISKRINSKITLVSETIGQTTRSFIAESKIASDPALKPNQVAIIRILDHASKNAMVIPVATIQTDEKGKFVYVLDTQNGKTVAKKKPVVVGELYEDKIEIRQGLQANDQLITQGFQGLYEGQLITTK